MTYRVGPWGITIVRCIPADCPDEPVAVVVNGDQALAERIAWLLNAWPTSGHPRTEADGLKWLHPTCIDVTGLGKLRGSEWVCGADCPREEGR